MSIESEQDPEALRRVGRVVAEARGGSAPA
jgi:hypothetical protein